MCWTSYPIDMCEMKQKMLLFLFMDTFYTFSLPLEMISDVFFNMQNRFRRVFNGKLFLGICFQFIMLDCINSYNSSTQGFTLRRASEERVSKQQQNIHNTTKSNKHEVQQNFIFFFLDNLSSRERVRVPEHMHDTFLNISHSRIIS